jgi:uncharacterized protein YeeX (DUF496 family)
MKNYSELRFVSCAPCTGNHFYFTYDISSNRTKVSLHENQKDAVILVDSSEAIKFLKDYMKKASNGQTMKNFLETNKTQYEWHVGFYIVDNK